MNISRFLVECSRVCAYISLLSTLASLTELFQKCVLLKFKTPETIKKSHYFTYLAQKSPLRFVIASLPFLGNISIATYDLSKKPSRHLVAWINEEERGVHENRREAAHRIREAYNNHSPKLDLSFLNLRSLPPFLSQLTHLRDIDLSKNLLKSFPSELNDLIFLCRLDLSANELETLPEEISRLHYLQDLKLGGNRLSRLPTELASLRFLKSLDISYNKLANLPAYLENLEVFDYRGQGC